MPGSGPANRDDWIDKFSERVKRDDEVTAVPEGVARLRFHSDSPTAFPMRLRAAGNRPPTYRNLSCSLSSLSAPGHSSSNG